ncbi:MAG: hypothetical protein FWE15_20950 [Actinomycetia bacterium]|nr:hypothetical protein [Actinomycetes bacterium]
MTADDSPAYDEAASGLYFAVLACAEAERDGRWSLADVAATVARWARIADEDQPGSGTRRRGAMIDMCERIAAAARQREEFLPAPQGGPPQ